MRHRSWFARMARAIPQPQSEELVVRWIDRRDPGDPNDENAGANDDSSHTEAVDSWVIRRDAHGNLTTYPLDRDPA